MSFHVACSAESSRWKIRALVINTSCVLRSPKCPKKKSAWCIWNIRLHLELLHVLHFLFIVVVISDWYLCEFVTYIQPTTTLFVPQIRTCVTAVKMLMMPTVIITSLENKCALLGVQYWGHRNIPLQQHVCDYSTSHRPQAAKDSSLV